MNTFKVDGLNLILLLFSFLIAIILPFKLFLFSYAVLGPIHYMTEIGWLREKGYYLNIRQGFSFLVALCAIVTVGTLGFEYIKTLNTEYWQNFLNDYLELASSFLSSLVFIAFIGAGAFTFSKSKIVAFGILGLSCVVAFFASSIPSYTYIFGLFLPTILHVSLFTLLFMIYGAIKSKSKLGFINALIFLICWFAFFQMDFNDSSFRVSERTIEQYFASGFPNVLGTFAEFIGLLPDGNYFVKSSLGYKFQAFLAFVYTYHYLNWFSKTKIINWHKVSKKWLAGAVAVWVASVSLYFYDYKYGLFALFFLSYLHVFLEFPLNHLSMKGIIDELFKFLKPAKA